MKTVLKKVILAAAVGGFCAYGAMAQKDDNQNRPPKEKPPVIAPSDKERPKDPPKDNGNRPNKPNEVFYLREE